MTAAHSHAAHPIEAHERKELARIQAEPKFQRAYAKYTKTNSEHHVPYLAGSSKDGTTVYFDPRVPAAARKTIAIHEKVEGILVRLYGFSYAKAHKYATQAEREVVGSRWKTYQAGLEEPIRQAEHAPKRNLPPDLLMAAYASDKPERPYTLDDYAKGAVRRAVRGHRPNEPWPKDYDFDPDPGSIIKPGSPAWPSGNKRTQNSPDYDKATERWGSSRDDRTERDDL